MMPATLSNPPIILIGTHRSGTTWLGNLFAEHPDVAYWEEPRHVWTRGNAATPDDRLDESHARPEVVRRIHESFASFAAQRGKAWFCEKTPSNCLRVPFIRRVFPDAKLLFVVRDGRSVVRSTLDILQSGVPTGRVWQRAMETPLREWPSYVPRAVSVLRRRLTNAPLNFWGPRPPGWKEWIANDPIEVVLAKQWAGTISAAIDDFEHVGEDHVYRFRYEDMVTDPRTIMGRIVRFEGLPQSEHLIDEAASSARPETIDRWRQELDQSTLEMIRPHMEPVLERLGYEW